MGDAFEVVVKHEGKPLRGVVVEIRTSIPKETIVFSTATDSKGRARITKLPPGDYWLNAEFLGIGSAYHCFHVALRPSNRAKRILNYTWGDFSPTAPTITGTLIDRQPGAGGTPLWNATHSVEVPISRSKLRLQNATTGETFNTTSDAFGSFDFGSVRDGTYVLHIEGGETGRSYNPTDFVLKVRRGASADNLVLSRYESTCGNGLSLSLKKLPKPQ